MSLLLSVPTIKCLNQSCLLWVVSSSPSLRAVVFFILLHYSLETNNSVNRPLETPGKEVTPRPEPTATKTSMESTSSEDEDDDYETRIEKQERKQDEAVKKRVISALQNALSDIQLTGIQIDFEEIEILERIGVGGFAIVYKGYYRYISLDRIDSLVVPKWPSRNFVFLV